MRWTLALVGFPLLVAAPTRLYYSKSFPGSTPAYVEITVDRDGNGEYKEAADDDRPLKFQLTNNDGSALFDLADKLGRFNRPLESPLKVAFMGMKTFRFDGETEKHEVKFNYSEDADARALADWFERIIETEQHLINLERAAKYDKLGVNKALLQLQMSFDRKRLVAPQQLLPMLDRIAKNDTYIHMARERAAGMADAIRANR